MSPADSTSGADATSAIAHARDRIGARVEVARTIATATARSLRERRSFDQVEAFCMFIGYPRSGHSLVGSLLDAHPEVVLAHELDALKFLSTGLVGRDQLYSMLLRRDREFTEGGRRWTFGFDYSVPGQSQGGFERLRVIGDKKGGATTRRLADDPGLLDRLRDVVGAPIRAIHVVRNPFDVIASMHRRGAGSLTECRDRFLELCATNAGLRQREGLSVVDVRHEELVRRPQGVLAELCGFLGVQPRDLFLDSCAGVVYDEPHRSRELVTWPASLVDEIHAAIADVDFLCGYAFDG